MAIQNGFFKSINGDRRYLAEFFTSYFASFIGNGVFPNPSTNLQVINNQNFSTIVRPGKGWINGHYLNNDDNIVINHQPPDGVLRRIDRIVFSVNLDSRSMDIYLKQGTPSSAAVAPTLIRNSTLYELALADIAFNPGATSISQSNITDQRMNRALCGIVHGVVEQLDTTTLFNQYQQFLIDKGVEFDQQLAVNQQIFDDWFAQLNDILDGDVAANLANMIITHTNNATPQKHIEVVNSIPSNLANKGLLLQVDDLDNPNNPPEVPTSMVLSQRIDDVNGLVTKNDDKIYSEYINVKFPPGTLVAAKGDNATDDYQALLAMFNYANTNKISKIVFPDGTYLCSGTLPLFASFNLEGLTKSTVRIVYTGTDSLFKANNYPNRLNNVKMSNLRLEGTNRNGVGLDLTNVSYSLFENVWSSNFNKAILMFSEGSTGGCAYNSFRDVFAQNSNIAVDANLTGGFVTYNQWYGGRMATSNIGIKFGGDGGNISLFTIFSCEFGSNIKTADIYGNYLTMDRCWIEPPNANYDNAVEIFPTAFATKMLNNRSKDNANSQFQYNYIIDNGIATEIVTPHLNLTKGSDMQMLENYHFDYYDASNNLPVSWSSFSGGTTELINDPIRGNVVKVNSAGGFSGIRQMFTVQNSSQVNNGCLLSIDYFCPTTNIADTRIRVENVNTGVQYYNVRGLDKGTAWNRLVVWLPIREAGSYYVYLFSSNNASGAGDYVLYDKASIVGLSGVEYNAEKNITENGGNILSRDFRIGGRRHTYASSIPTSGTWQRGDRVYNILPSANGTEGWVCVVSGNPGTWKTFGIIEA